MITCFFWTRFSCDDPLEGLVQRYSDPFNNSDFQEKGGFDECGKFDGCTTNWLNPDAVPSVFRLSTYSDRNTGNPGWTERCCSPPQKRARQAGERMVKSHPRVRYRFKYGCWCTVAQGNVGTVGTQARNKSRRSLTFSFIIDIHVSFYFVALGEKWALFLF